jgi:hypothetical protein
VEDGLLDVIGPVNPDAEVVGCGQVVQSHGPVLREALLRVNLLSLIGMAIWDAITGKSTDLGLISIALD